MEEWDRGVGQGSGMYGWDIGHSTHSDNERGNPLPPLHGLVFPKSSKGSFICTIPQTG